MVPLYNTCSSGVTVSNWSFLRAFTLFLTTTGRAEMSRDGWNSWSSASLFMLSLSDMFSLETKCYKDRFEEHVEESRIGCGESK